MRDATRAAVAAAVIGWSCLATHGTVAWGWELLALPAQATLHGARARQPLLVQRVRDGVVCEQVSEVRWRVEDPSIAVVDNAVVRPAKNGQTRLIATTPDGETAEIALTVVGMDRGPRAPTFRNHVQPVLARAGCNSGACHGALAGKGGFRLSLRGYDADADYRAITRELRGRRIELADPGRSLILAKPTGALPHRGGVRLEAGDANYQVLADWIAGGAMGPENGDPRLQRVEVLPDSVLAKTGTRQQLVVRAHYSDGVVEDVTRWCKFASANEAVTRVDEDGQIEVIGPGASAVTAWFSSRIAMCRFTSPYPNEPEAAAFAESPVHNFIDELVLERLRLLRLPPSPQADDAEFLRRAFLDTIGTLPTVNETRTFLNDDSPDKRDRLIDSLLARSEFVDYWAYRWSDLLLVNGQLLRPKAVESFYRWIRQQVAENTPWDEFARRVLTAKGDTFANGAANFYAIHQDPETMTENASQAFMSLSIGCAKCHNHPLEKWTNDQYYAMANLFARVKAKGWGGDARNGDGRRTVYVSERGDLIQPLSGQAQPPTPLDGEPLSFDDPRDRRAYLAGWMTSPDNPYFSRAIANRIWASFMGVGLVESVDDMRLTNPATNEALLDALASYVEQNHYDVTRLMKLILQSAAYQRSSRPLAGNREERRFYARYYPKRLIAEVMLDAISGVVQLPTRFDTVEFSGADRQKTDFYPNGTRAIQLYDSAVGSYFLRTFGRHQRRITCDCERSNEPSLVQALHLNNGDTLNEKLKAADNRIDRALRRSVSDATRLNELFLAALSRKPTDSESERFLTAIREASPAQRRTAWEDAFWAVLTSREFLFNH